MSLSDVAGAIHALTYNETIKMAQWLCDVAADRTNNGEPLDHNAFAALIQDWATQWLDEEDCRIADGALKTWGDREVNILEVEQEFAHSDHDADPFAG